MKKFLAWYNGLTSDKKLNYKLVMQLLLLIAICVLHALSAGHYVNFKPLNGTFQNFNPVRRFLDGQIPYRDFQDYLGLGHLYTGTITTVLFGGDYRASLCAFSFLTLFSFSLILIVLLSVIISKKNIVVSITNIFLVLLLVNSELLENVVGATIFNAVEKCLTVGNSARFIRGMILPISILLLYFGFKVYDKHIANKVKKNKWKDIIIFCGIGIVAGFAFLWSNDYGISCWVCFVVSSFWLALSRSRKIGHALLMMLLEIISSMVAIFIFVSCFTFGHFTNWLNATFGTGGYQSWYYNGDNSFFVYDIDISFYMMFQAILVIVYMMKLFMQKGSKHAVRRYGILGFSNMVAFCAVNEYKILSGGSMREIALSVLFVTLLVEVFNIVMTLRIDKGKFARITVLAATALSVAWIVYQAKEELIFDVMTNKDGVYIEELGGNIQNRGNDLIEAKEFLKDNKFFATYASAQEVVSNTYQPSGTDYIIHVLGDSKRLEYLESFNTGDFKYTATISDTYTSWEYWVQRANWFFYRELYKKWHPVYANTYEVYWERNADENENVVTSGFEYWIEDVDETTKKIVVQCDEPINVNFQNKFSLENQ